jgi:3-phosphoshikimate 1-carboxyvinyltransferase
MNCKVEKSKISGHIKCPANKSYSHRAIFLASLAGNNSKIDNVLFSADTIATIETCRKFGAEIEELNTSIIVKKPINTNKIVPEIDAKNSGTTIRIASGKRPMQPLLDALESIGAKCISTNGMPPIKITGKILGGDVSIPGNFSSQFISALLICSPLTEKGINLVIEGNLVSKPYLDATIATMKNFGVTVQTLIPYKRYNIKPQVYKPSIFTVPIDFSSLALLLSASVLNGENVVIHGKMGNLPQGDEVFIDILEQLGVTVSIKEDEITIQSPERLNGGRFDLSNSPDLLPPLAILALKTTNSIEITNVKHARLKETDRISILARELVKIGIRVQEKEDGLILESPKELRRATLNSENDHRLFMAFCIVGMYVGNCVVTDHESVAVSYPDFIKEMNKMGAKILIQ